MNRLKYWFTQRFKNKSGGESSSTKSLFKLAPCTFILAFVLGIPLSSPLKFGHLILVLVAFLLRVWLTYCNLRPLQLNIDSVNQMSYYSLAYLSFWLLAKKSRAIVQFISSNPHSTAKVRKLDILTFLFYFVVTVLTYIPLFDEEELESDKEAFVPKFLDFSPTLKEITFTLLLLYHTIWLQLSPLCAIIYALGYRVLFEFKMNTLTSLFTSFHPVNYRPFLAKLKSVRERQKQFESIFSCFLFLSLSYNFLATVFFFLNVKLLTSQGKSFYYYYIVYCLFLQMMCIGWIFFVSFYNEKLKQTSDSVSAQLEMQLGENLPANSSLINFLQKKIHMSINEPLTACKMVTVDRQIVLATATSCVSFAVLVIQINNGALA